MDKMQLGELFLCRLNAVLTFTDYIDLFLIHNPHSGTEKRLETYKALLEAKNAGKIKSVGVSN